MDLFVPVFIGTVFRKLTLMYVRLNWVFVRVNWIDIDLYIATQFYQWKVKSLFFVGNKNTHPDLKSGV